MKSLDIIQFFTATFADLQKLFFLVNAQKVSSQ
ncbi:unknown [Bacteroides sp. CAG:754]|nr:unknown [Bacteroides sp. CAG:754]